MFIHLFIDPAPTFYPDSPSPLVLVFLLPSSFPSSLLIHWLRMRDIRTDASGIHEVGVLLATKVVREQAAVEPC